MQATNQTLQHINVKFFLQEPGELDQDNVLNLFHRWIQEDTIEDLLIDVADYRHVPDGPGVILVAHNAFYSLDNSDGRLGLLFNRRTPVDGDAREAVRQALQSASEFARRMAAAEELRGKVSIDRRHLQIAVNDRHFARNTEETLAAFRPALDSALNETLGEAGYSLKRASDPRARFTVEVTCERDFNL